jgi:hypothetical protein
MKTQPGSTVVGVFKDRLQAINALNALDEAGFGEEQVGLITRNAESATGDSTNEVHSEAGTGAITGAVAGLGLGALAGLGVLAGVIPVIGPAIAAGTLGVIVSNAGAGAGIAGLVGYLVGGGLHEDEAKYYQSELEAGHTIVTVNAGSQSGEAAKILRQCGGDDMDSQKAMRVSS